MLKCSESLFPVISLRTIWQNCPDPTLKHICYLYIIILVPETAASSSARNRPSKQYRCSICDKPFDSAETLESHQRFEHSEPGHSKPVAGVG